MHRITIFDATPGMRLAMPVYNERGEVLLRSRVALTPTYLSLLRQKGCTVIWIHDQDTEDIRIIDILSERLRGHAFATIASALTAGQASIQAVQGSTSEERARFVESDEFKRGLGAFPMEAIEKVANGVTEEVLGGPKLTSLFTAVRLDDSYLHAHSIDSTVTALLLGRRARLDRTALQRLAAACLLHDLGMMLIDPSILTKPGPLDEGEMLEMRQHTTLGFALLETVQKARLANLVALQHHERQNGAGYPRGMTGPNKVVSETLKRKSGYMTFMAEIVAVADVHDALSIDRPYRPATAPEHLPAVLRSLAGSHLNSELVDHLLELVPFYPPGTEVVVTRGSVAGCRGVVVKPHPSEPLRPVIRLLHDRAGERMRPVEIDLCKVRSVEIRSRLSLQPRPAPKAENGAQPAAPGGGER